MLNPSSGPGDQLTHMPAVHATRKEIQWDWNQLRTCSWDPIAGEERGSTVQWISRISSQASIGGLGGTPRVWRMDRFVTFFCQESLENLENRAKDSW